MQINADLTKRAVMHSAELDWVPSPLPGVERRMLERDGGEMAQRATTVVRYAPGSYFTPHTHDLGEEFIVLDGVFSDESGHFKKGMYVRNPPGSRHRPSSAPGCTILVKLQQMQPDDQNTVRMDMTDEAQWQVGRVAGERRLTLYESAHEVVQMLSWTPDVKLGRQTYPGGAEYFVLEGSFVDEDDTYVAGSWLRLPPGSSHEPRTDEGCRVYVKTGHLA